MAVGKTEKFKGPYTPSALWLHWAVGLALLMAGLAMTVAVLTSDIPIVPRILLIAIMTLPPTVFGGNRLYGLAARKAHLHVYYVLNRWGLTCHEPEATTTAGKVAWGSMRRLEAAGDTLILHFVGESLAPDPIPKLGHQFNTLVLGDAYRRFHPTPTVQPLSVTLDPATTSTAGAKFGERFPIWFAKYATATDPADGENA